MELSEVNPLPLFVFGTLCRGRRNYYLLEGRHERMLPAVLKDFRRLHPLMIVPSPGDEVDGELYFLRRDVHTETLADCDELEGIPRGATAGNRYCRRQVTVETAEGPRSAWAYVASETE